VVASNPWLASIAAVAVVTAQAPKPNPFDVLQPAMAQGALVTTDTAHVRLTAALSPTTVAPGTKLSIAYDVSPHRGMHVYAPGKHDYQVISVTLDPQPWLKAAPIKYPPSEIYHFKPIDERVEVYSKPFRLVQDVTILNTPDAQKILAKGDSVAITGRVSYQACDDTVCYLPTSVPMKWTVPLQRK
jgi:hypothetical protein